MEPLAVDGKVNHVHIVEAGGDIRHGRVMNGAVGVVADSTHRQHAAIVRGPPAHGEDKRTLWVLGHECVKRRGGIDNGAALRAKADDAVHSRWLKGIATLVHLLLAVSNHNSAASPLFDLGDGSHKL